MTPQETMKLVEECGLNIEGLKNIECESVIFSALAKQIPIKVKVEQFNRYNIYYCPTCDGCIGDSFGHIGDGFCSSCGQALDWSVTDV